MAIVSHLIKTAFVWSIIRTLGNRSTVLLREYIRYGYLSEICLSRRGSSRNTYMLLCFDRTTPHIYKTFTYIYILCWALWYQTVMCMWARNKRIDIPQGALSNNSPYNNKNCDCLHYKAWELRHLQLPVIRFEYCLYMWSLFKPLSECSGVNCQLLYRPFIDQSFT